MKRKKELRAPKGFRDIVGWEGVYAVSKDGKVYSYPKDWSGGHSGKYLKASISDNKYLIVAFSKLSKRKSFRIHQLVAKTWIPNPKMLPCINHKNGIKSDNRVENLEWCSWSENAAHAVKTGLITTAKRKKLRLRKEQVKKIRLDLKTHSVKCVAKQTGMSYIAILKIKNGSAWKNI